MARGIRIPAGLIALGAAAGFIVSVIDYTSPTSGINGTAGAMLVIASCTAIFLAALVLVFWPKTPGWLRGILLFLLFLGILGTGLAAYFLTSIWLQVAMAVCLVGWVLSLFGRNTAKGNATTAHGGATS